MLSIAVTGGIGSGKSLVSEYIREAGFTVIDADAMSRAMTSAGGKAIPYIRENFGPEFINEDGSLNRAMMRDLVFRDPRKKALLEAGTTKVVLEDIEAIRREREQSGDRALFFDIPLLYETGTESDYDVVWAVTADYEVRAARVMARDGIDASIIDLIMGSQADEEYKISRADYVIINNGTTGELMSRVDDALRAYDLI
ncbi:MAG: dephospho-CoA kinase [Clostridiales bacterium]|jgi:dephospho-CoA kinase|nr:dephospho-CoA kinase [Clostridiales bacterium]